MSHKISKIFVTVDAVIFRKAVQKRQLLLIRRKNEPFKNKWALPGGFVDEHEDLEVAARRELYEETGIKVDSLEQLQAFGKPHRDPRGHMISIAYTGTAQSGDLATAGDDADEAQWFSVDELPELAFDHDEIINVALNKTNR